MSALLRMIYSIIGLPSVGYIPRSEKKYIIRKDFQRASFSLGKLKGIFAYRAETEKKTDRKPYQSTAEEYPD